MQSLFLLKPLGIWCSGLAQDFCAHQALLGRDAVNICLNAFGTLE
jgi:hypothetical protein